MKRSTIPIMILALALGVSMLACEGGDLGAGDDDDDGDGAADADTDADSDADSDGDGDGENENQGDQYEAVGTNPFVYTAHDPFSTFAADVDTASYDIFRRDIELGYLPDPASVRLEEYVNSFGYDYEAPAPDGEHPLAISLAAAPGLAGYESTLLRVGIQGEVIPESDKPQANLVFLVDVSGSMSASNKLPLVQHLLTVALDYLDPDDTISLVTYASNTGVMLEPTPVAEKETIAAAIAALQSGGSTSGAAGIDLAYQQAEAAFLEDGVNHVLLCTDGDFNVGPSTNGELIALIEEKRESGITLTVLGFGVGNLNDSMMEAISNAGNGTYAVISSVHQAEKYAQFGLLNGMFFIAKDVKLQVEFNPDQVLAYRLLGYENRDLADDDFTDDTVDAGEIGSGHRVTAYYELIFPGEEVPQPEGAPEPESGPMVDGVHEIASGDMVLVQVRYKEPDASQADAAFETSASMTSEQILPSVDEAGDDFKWAAAIASFAEVLKQSPFADPADLEAIAATLASVETADEDRLEFLGLFETALTLF
ncbi:MAG TPA: von Willebrand factor type A domain-containing protein [Polyangia bacterium]|nr:von Willebrand factor type A domain-containing protein [Polyangia bacterium]